MMNRRSNKASKVRSSACLLVCSTLAALSVGCSVAESSVLRAASLFSLDYGKQEKELDIYPNGTPRSTKEFSLFYANGFVYISNTQAAKLMVLSSYGDLLQLYYNPAISLAPVSLQEVDLTKKTTTFAVPYKSKSFGAFAVLDDNTLVVVEEIASQRITIDQSTGVRLAYQLRLFSADGIVLQSIGQEGSGGTPFPVIESVFALENNKIMVVANFLREKRVFIYSNALSLLYEIRIPTNELPVPFTDNIVPQLAFLAPEYSGDILYAHIHYFQKKLNKDKETVYGIEYVDSAIYELSLAKQQYTRAIEAGIENKDRGLAEFIGVSRSNHLYFIRYLDSKEVELIAMNTEGKVLLRHREVVGNILNLYTSITANGDIIALLLREKEAELVLWELSEGASQ